MRYELKIDYPCGYKFVLIVNSWHLIYTKDSEQEYRLCPIHGKNCKGVKK